MTKKDYDAKMAALESMSDEERKRVTCALLGHSHITTGCFGYIHCARCGEQIGDVLSGMFYDPLEVRVGHNCPVCRTNYAKLGWESRILTPDPFLKEKERCEMTIQEIIDSLEEQAQDKEEFADRDNPGDILMRDVRALTEAVDLLRKFDISTTVGEPQNLMQKYEVHCMFRANRLKDGTKVYGSLVPETSAGMMSPAITAWHIVQRGYWNGVPMHSDDLVDPETAAIYLGQNDRYGHGVYVPLKDVAAALKTGGADVPPPNEPLTLEELRQMDGEPVWVKCVGIGGRIYGLWVVIHGEMLHGYKTGSDGPVNLSLRPNGAYGIGWLAYRRKPEEAENG